MFSLDDCDPDGGSDEECRIDLLVIVDESGSVGIDSTREGGRDFWNLDMKPFLENLVDSLDIGEETVHMAMIMYNDK